MLLINASQSSHLPIVALSVLLSWTRDHTAQSPVLSAILQLAGSTLTHGPSMSRLTEASLEAYFCDSEEDRDDDEEEDNDENDFEELGKRSYGVRRGRQSSKKPKKRGRPRRIAEIKRERFETAAIDLKDQLGNNKKYLCSLCGRTLTGLTAYIRYQVQFSMTNSYF